jgi:hypothetical protein
MMENMDQPPPVMEEDDAPADSTATPSPEGGGKATEQARRNP